MTEINLTLDRRNLARFRTLMKASQTSAAKSLTFTAEKAVPAWRAGHSVFHKRNNWIDKGVRMRPASASNLNAQVGTIDKYMGRHVEGIGEEKQPDGSGALLVPVYGSIADAPTHRRMRAALKRAAATKRKPFVIRTKGGQAMLVRRKTKKRKPLVILARLTRKVDIDERLDALSIVDDVVRREFPRVYERLLLAWAAKG